MPSATVVACPVCNDKSRRPVLALDGGWEIERCGGCDRYVLSPEPADVRLEEFNDGSGYDGAFDFRDAILQQHDRSLRALERRVRPGALLDVGCGPGLLLEVARARGWKATGVDPSPFSVTLARSLGFNTHQGMLEDLRLPEASFDALALLQVVEHVPDPRPLLAECRRLLRPGGALLVATPNPASLLAKVKREGFNYWIPPIHCVWYPPATLARLLQQAGFEVARRGTWSARAAGLHDGADIVAASRFGRRLPAKLRRVAGETVARAADATGRGSIVEQIAIRGDA
ncbi:MAG TPA: class I SAM-dependent methyltransferase [Actinomycetota bacterium]